MHSKISMITVNRWPRWLCLSACFLLIFACVWGEESKPLPAPLQQALAQPEGKERDKAVIDAAVEWQKSEPAVALGWVVVQPQSLLIRSIVIAVSQAWAKRDAPAAVACAWDFAKKFVKMPPKTLNDGYVLSALHLTLKQWARSDPKAAVAWADTSVPADSSKDIMRWVFGSVGGGYAEVDPVAAAAWAEAVKDDEGRHWAFQAIAGTWSFFHKPEDAAVWAKRLPPAELKIDVVRPIFEALYRRDAAKATAWLDSLTIPDEMKAELKTKAELKKPKP